MKHLILLACFAGCAAIPPTHPGSNNCGMRTGGDYKTHGPSWLTFEILADRLDAALDAASFTTDTNLMYAEESCRRLVGFTVYTRPERSWPDPYGRGFNVAGLTWCDSRTIHIGTPEDGKWKHSVLVHELFHGMQNCKAPGPPDLGGDTDHANWFRDGIYDAIERAQK